MIDRVDDSVVVAVVVAGTVRDEQVGEKADRSAETSTAAIDGS